MADPSRRNSGFEATSKSLDVHVGYLRRKLEADGERRLIHTVRRGDSLYTIAQRFNVNVERIRDWNQLGRYLQPGQQLTLFVP